MDGGVVEWLACWPRST